MAFDDSARVPPDFELPGWETTPEGLILHVRMRSAWLNIHVQTKNFHTSPIALEALQSTKAKFGSEDEENNVWEHLEELASYFIPAFRNVAPKVNHVGNLTLEDLQLRHYFQCRLDFHDELPRASAITRTDPIEEIDCGCDNLGLSTLQCPLPRFRPRDVEVSYSDPTTIFEVIPEKVVVNGQSLFWKPPWILDELKEGIEKYDRIRQSDIPPAELLTSRLYGIVVDSRGLLSGQLYYWIEVERRLTWKTAEGTPYTTRAKWISQIRNTVSRLHNMSVIWGVVKAENVIVDKAGNAIVIDFEGGATRGWIDDEKMGTKQGDLQG
ncbi:hypothetical protein LTR12_017884, partial [Friedmanniomyces endolithicus]